jgi:hypothetical protein
MEVLTFDRKKMTHYARVDWWVATLLGGVALVEVATGAVVLLASLGTGRPDARMALIVGLVLVGAGFLVGFSLWGCYETRYEVAPPNLIMRFGPFVARIPLDPLSRCSRRITRSAHRLLPCTGSESITGEKAAGSGLPSFPQRTGRRLCATWPAPRRSCAGQEKGRCDLRRNSLPSLTSVAVRSGSFRSAA